MMRERERKGGREAEVASLQKGNSRIAPSKKEFEHSNDQLYPHLDEAGAVFF